MKKRLSLRRQKFKMILKLNISVVVMSALKNWGVYSYYYCPTTVRE